MSLVGSVIENIAEEPRVSSCQDIDNHWTNGGILFNILSGYTLFNNHWTNNGSCEILFNIILFTVLYVNDGSKGVTPYHHAGL